MTTRAFQKVYTKIDNITKATITLRATGVGNDELATVGGRLAQVVKIMGDKVTLQVFASFSFTRFSILSLKPSNCSDFHSE